MTESAGDVDGVDEAMTTLEALLERLSTIDEVPLDERPALFERANEVLVAALADLEEV